MDNHLVAEYTSLYYMTFKEFRDNIFVFKVGGRLDEYTDCPINLSPSKVQDVFMELGLSLSLWRKRLKLKDPWKRT